MADDTDPAPPPEQPPAPPTFKAPATWVLFGPARSTELDAAVQLAVEIGCDVQRVRAGAYRPHASLEELTKLAECLNHLKLPGVGMCIEQPPEKPRLRFDLAPQRPPVRSAEIHAQGDHCARMVARAIDAGLTVRREGVGRFRVVGQTRQHVTWVADLFEVSEARALEVMQLTREQAIAEDTAAPPVAVNVELPTREITSVIGRDPRTGDITNVTQTERSV